MYCNACASVRVCVRACVCVCMMYLYCPKSQFANAESRESPTPLLPQGSSTTSSWDVPLQAKGLPHGKITHLELGGYYSACAVINASSVWCWGYNGYGELGDGSYTSRYTPVKVQGLANNITDFTYGWACGCVIEGTAADGSTGAVKCWGYNAYGNLGDGTATTRTTPVDTGLRDAVMVKMSTYSAPHTKVITSDGTMYAFGYNSYCQLGDGTKYNRLSPVDINWPTQYQVTSLGMGAFSTHVQTKDGAQMAWGYNLYGQVTASYGGKESRPSHTSHTPTPSRTPHSAGRRYEDRVLRRSLLRGLRGERC